MTIEMPLPASVTAGEAKFLLALKLFELGRISSGKAAELAGCTKQEFMVRTAGLGVPTLSYPAEELKADLRNAWADGSPAR